MKSRTVALAALVAALVIPSIASAQSSARRYLEQRHEEVNRILRREATTDAARARRSQQLTTILNNLLDYEALSEAALAEHWAERSVAEREQFVTLLRRLVERNYEGNLERILDYEVSYDDETRRDDRTVVTTSARSRTERRQPPVEIEYTLTRDGGSYRVVDVRTDGVSMVQNYRAQFHRIIDREGWNELIARMERRLEENSG
jgi:phospholipid transport system substrate-binding protein